MLFAFLSSVALASPISVSPSLPVTAEAPAIVADCRRYRCSPQRVSDKVIVEFVARGSDWGNVWINGSQVFQPRNFNRTQAIALYPGAYRVLITGLARFEVWASGYLDVGRANVVKIAFNKDGEVEVSGDPNAWLPDDKNQPDVWRR